MIKLTSNVVNETLVLKHILPDKKNVSHLIDTALTKVYVFGRSWILTQVRKTFTKCLPTYFSSLIGCKSSTGSC